MFVARLIDREIFDTGNMWSELDPFHHRIEHLFVKGKALSTEYAKTSIGVSARTLQHRRAGNMFVKPWMQIRRRGNQHHTCVGPDGKLGPGDE